MVNDVLLSETQQSSLRRPTRRWPRRRELIDDEDRLTIPVLGRYLIEAELV